ncbi:hypothetical protein D9K79_04860 [Acinetobacter cumulans]|uniref:Uncharacterized protein n=1 Tax=Acinetobacter cumulans TaxID=2136182 RepID=A0ABX9U8D8_9GAMM|nr:hypothetical protein [Acinetobacter cumulans]RLL48763.1 hypothetical protein D9K79_04860 [Acinetobacter cumulans]
MSDLQAEIAFSLADEQLKFEVDGQIIEISKGLNFIIAQSVRFGGIDALAIENMIYVIEELLEQLKLDFRKQRKSQTADESMRQISTLFFNDAKHIDRNMLEHAFNEWVERLEYYTNKVGHDFKLWAYFVMIREMMHHLNVFTINLNN